MSHSTNSGVVISQMKAAIDGGWLHVQASRRDVFSWFEEHVQQRERAWFFP